MNSVYSIFDIASMLKHFRLNPQNRPVLTQKELGRKIGKCQRYISKIELGEENLSLDLIAEWCKITGWYEGWEYVSHTYNLHPLATPPIHPELNRDLGDAIINMKSQMKQALESLEALEEAYNSRRPTRAIEIDHMLKRDAREIFDLIPATRTILYSAERDIGLDIDEISQSWTQACMADELIMPSFSKMSKQAI